METYRYHILTTGNSGKLEIGHQINRVDGDEIPGTFEKVCLGCDGLMGFISHCLALTGPNKVKLNTSINIQCDAGDGRAEMYGFSTHPGDDEARQMARSLRVRCELTR